MTTFRRLCFVLTLTACTSTEPAETTPPSTDAPAPPMAPIAAAMQGAALPEPAVAVGPASPTRPACAEVIAFDARLGELAVSAADIAAALKIMGAPTPDVSRSPDQQRAEMLSRKLAEPLPALAHLLVDDELGDSVAFTMFEIDEAQAAPWVFASMPKSDRNVQYHSFARFLRRIHDADAPCWDAIVRDAASRTLDEGTNADAAEVTLLALGVTGTRGDIRRVRSYVDHPSSKTLPEVWQQRLTSAARAALARLGDRPTIDALRRELDVPIRQLDREGAERMVAVIDGAGFSRQRELAEVVCRHLAAPVVPPDGHMLAPQPNERAAAALAQIVDGASADEVRDVELWAKRCRERAL